MKILPRLWTYLHDVFVAGFDGPVDLGLKLRRQAVDVHAQKTAHDG